RPPRRAASNTSGACVARSALLAVTTSLPAASRSSTARRAQSTPPTSSTATWIEGSVRTERISVVKSSRGKATGRCLFKSRTSTRRSTSARPARAARRCGCSSSKRATPLPTVPQPIKATPSGSIFFLRDELLQVALALPQCALAVFEGSFKGPVFYLNANWTAVACIRECGEEPAPVHVSQSRQLGGVPAHAQIPKRVKPVPIDARVLGVHVEDSFTEVPRATDIIYLLPDQVRRVEIEPQARTRDLPKNRLPDGGRDRQVFAAGPFILAEEHGAILDAEVDAFRLSMGDDLRPNALEERPVRIDRPSGVAANKGIDQANVKPRRGADDFPQMIDDETALLGIGVERVRIVTQRGDGDSILPDQVANLLNPIVIETRHIDVAYAGIAPVGVPRWP